MFTVIANQIIAFKEKEYVRVEQEFERLKVVERGQQEENEHKLYPDTTDGAVELQTIRRVVN